ncbi:hypothetical protein ACTXT7_010631 [Hymenolepis weldensis]
MTDPRAERVKKAIKAYPDFPKTGINFLDIFPIFQDQTTINDCIALMTEEIQKRFLNEGQEIDAIVGLESRGFIFGILISTHFKVPFIPIRKAGKLPGECVKYSYDLEYGSFLYLSKFKASEKEPINLGSKWQRDRFCLYYSANSRLDET